MTTLNPQALSSPSGASRARLALSAVLAVAALGVGGTATGVLVTGSLAGGSATTSAAPVAQPVAAPAPAAPAAPAPAAVLPAPAAAPLAVADTRGTALPAATERGARTVFDALGAGDLTALRAAYAPGAGGASWSAVQRVLADPRDRAGLLAAMSAPPQTGGAAPYLYARDGFRLGLDDAGRIRFVRAP